MSPKKNYSSGFQEAPRLFPNMSLFAYTPYPAESGLLSAILQVKRQAQNSPWSIPRTQRDSQDRRWALSPLVLLRGALTPAAWPVAPLCHGKAPHPGAFLPAQSSACYPEQQFASRANITSRPSSLFPKAWHRPRQRCGSGRQRRGWSRSKVTAPPPCREAWVRSCSEN